VRDAATVRKF